jgi:hypothetical protein
MRPYAAFAAVAVAVAAGHQARAERFSVPIDQNQSVVNVTLTLSGQSATDSSPVRGFVELSLDTVRTPLQVRGRDFRLELTEDLILNISFGIFGAFNSRVDDLVIYYATPGAAIGPVPINMGAFSFTQVPALTLGILNYTATGLVCATLQSQNPPLPCTDTDDLSTEPVQAIEFDSTLTTAGRVVTVQANIDRTAPIDPANPGLGTLRVVGTVRGSVTVPPIAGDADQDCAVTFADITSVLANFGNAGVGITGDANSDGEVSFGDITSVLANFGTVCD